MTATVKATHAPGIVDRYFDDIEAEPPKPALQGAFDIITEPSGQRRFWFVCPGPCKALSAIALRPVFDGSPQSWEFDGNLEAPTLTPSIHHLGCWHGYLTAGEFTSC